MAVYRGRVLFLFEGQIPSDRCFQYFPLFLVQVVLSHDVFMHQHGTLALIFYASIFEGE